MERVDDRVLAEQRKRCHAARDAAYECEEKHPASECAELRKRFEEECPSIWVRHFDRKRDQEAKMSRLMNQAHERNARRQ